jgi:hypothetical protein
VRPHTMLVLALLLLTIFGAATIQLFFLAR